MQKFFSNDIKDGRITLGAEDTRHLLILRFKIGEKVVISDERGTDYKCELESILKTSAVFKILDKMASDSEPDVKTALFQAMPKSEKCDFIIQKCVELGVSEIYFFISKRSVSRPDGKGMETKLKRFGEISKNAAMQCGRGEIPKIKLLSDFENVFNEMRRYELKLFLYECGGKPIKQTLENCKAGSIAYIIGPEGGFEESEAVMAAERGCITASLGKRILRAETAAVTTQGIIMYATGSL